MDLFAQLPHALRDPDALLRFVRGQTWTVSDLDGEGEKRAVSRAVRLDFRAIEPPPLAGQWYLVPLAASAMETYALGWYVCGCVDDVTKHLFGMAPASELDAEITAANLYERPDLLVACSLDYALCISSHRLYDGPGLFDALTKIIDLSHTHVAEAVPLPDVPLVHEDLAARRAKRRAYEHGYEGLDALTALSVAEEKPRKTGLFVSQTASAASNRRFLNAKRSLGRPFK